MIKEFLNSSDAKVPALAFHTMDLTDNAIVLYGGLNEENQINGNVYFLQIDQERFNFAPYENNEDSTI
jgi:hypothetical protein